MNFKRSIKINTRYPANKIETEKTAINFVVSIHATNYVLNRYKCYQNRYFIKFSFPEIFESITVAVFMTKFCKDSGSFLRRDEESGSSCSIGC